MGLVSKSIPNLINGISQQPPALRLSSQGELQENGLSDVVDGLKKRPPTKFLKKLVKCASNWTESTSSTTTGDLTSSNTQALTEAELASAAIQTYKRSGDEQYTVVILPHASTPTVLVYDIVGNLRYESGKSSWLADGTTITYVINSVTYYGNSDDTSYLVGDNSTVLSSNDITTTSVADATFIVNKKKTVDLDNTLIQPDVSGFNALVYLKSVNYGRDYKLTITTKDSQSSLNPIQANHPTANANSGQTNSDELKVSSVISALRSDIVTSNTGIFNSGGQVTFGTRSTFVYYDNSRYDPFTVSSNNYIETNVQNMMTYQLSTAAFNSDSTKLMVIVGGTVIPYSSSINTGWRYLDVANRKILLPKTVGSYTVTSTYGYDEDDEFQCTVPQAEFRNTANGVTSVATTLSPSSYTDEPYFVLTSPENGTLKDFNIIATDDDGGNNLRVFKDTAKSFSDLPNQCIDGFRIAVVGDNNKDEDNFHVKFEGAAGQGVWKETVKAGLRNFYDLTTMPHTLRQDPLQTGSLRFEFGQGEWDHRVAGDDDTNPPPSFVGSTISDIFFHRNRLGLLSGENVIFSESGSYFNFYRSTVRAILDSDPIDVAVSQNEVSELKAALPIQDSLLLFSELNQFTLSSDQLLTPLEVTIDQSTKFECDLTADPVGAGNSVFFSTFGGSYSGIREYYTEGDTEIDDADLITAHVPEYLSGKVRKMAASTNENVLVCLTTTNKKEAYIYKWYNQDNERVQSSWSKWLFDTDVVDISFNNSNLYITFVDGRFETMALRTDSPDLSYGNVFTNVVTTNISTYTSQTATNTNTNPNTVINGGGLTALATVAGSLMTITISLLTGKVTLTTPKDELTAVIINGTTLNTTDSNFTKTNPTVAGAWYTYEWDFNRTDGTSGVNTAGVTFFSSLNGATPAISISYVEGITFTGKSHDVLLDHRVKVTGITDVAGLDALVPDMDEYTVFVDYKGEIIGTGNSTATKNAVVNHIYANGAAVQHSENGANVDNYIFAGQPYLFKYGLSEQVFTPTQGDFTTLARFQLRSVTFNFNDTGTFDILNSTVGRQPTTTTFTGRVVGSTSNFIGYSSVVPVGSHTVAALSQASETKLTISNNSHLPCIFQSAEWEGYVVLRNRRM